MCLFPLQLSLSRLLILASSWNESLLLWTSLGSSLFQLGFCSRSLVLLPDLTELALFIVKSLWWCHGLSWFQSGFRLSTVEAGEWLCKLSFAGPDSFWHKTSSHIQQQPFSNHHTESHGKEFLHSLVMESQNGCWLSVRTQDGQVTNVAGHLVFCLWVLCAPTPLVPPNACLLPWFHSFVPLPKYHSSDP